MLARRQILRHDPDAADMLAELGARLLRQLLHFLHQRGAFRIKLRAWLNGLKSVRGCHCDLLITATGFWIRVKNLLATFRQGFTDVPKYLSHPREIDYRADGRLSFSALHVSTEICNHAPANHRRRRVCNADPFEN